MYSGLQHLNIEDPTSAASFPALVQYPTHTPPAGVQIGPYAFDATLEAPIAGGTFALCVISHGGGGSHLLYRTIATHLACNGYIVVCPEHPGDNRNDRTLSNTDATAELRPRHLSLAIDAVVANPFFGTSVDSTRICAVGHSMGGCAVLALAGGQPWSRARQPLQTQADRRLRAAVLLAPSTDWFQAPGALAKVAVPLLVLTAQHDAVTPTATVSRVLAGLPVSTPLYLREVPGAGHFSFLSPFPPPMRRADFMPSTDPEGFDREQFHLELPKTILEHLFEAMAVR